MTVWRAAKIATIGALGWALGDLLTWWLLGWTWDGDFFAFGCGAFFGLWLWADHVRLSQTDA